MLHLIYSPHHNIGFRGIERFHPFDTYKYEKAWKVLKQHFSQHIHTLALKTDREITREELLRVHSPEYLDSLSEIDTIIRIVEVPALSMFPHKLLDWMVLRPMRFATRATVLAAKECLKSGFMLNLGGGFHHAKPNNGEGFCVYNDIALAVHTLRDEKLISADSVIAYIDLDVHQGNGVCHAFQHDQQVQIFDMFNQHLYPASDILARRRINESIKLDSGCTDETYLTLLKTKLPAFLDRIQQQHNISLAIYNAGTDIFINDPLGCLNISSRGVLERDLFTVRTCRERNIPTLMLPSGGYTGVSYELISHAAINLVEDELR